MKRKSVAIPLADNIHISNHAIERYMQRYFKSNPKTSKNDLLRYLSKSKLIKLNSDGYEKRFYWNNG